MKMNIAHSGLAVAFAALLTVIAIRDAAQAQTVTATLNVGTVAQFGVIAVNPTTNSIYVPTTTGFSVINGATNSVTAYPLSNASGPAAVDPVTGNVYVATLYIDDSDPKFPVPVGGIAVIVPGTNSSSALMSKQLMHVLGIAVDPVTNKIYVSSDQAYCVAIDGETNAVTPIVFPGAGSSAAEDLDPVTNRIYVTAGLVGVTVIDGNAASVTATLPIGGDPFSVAVNPVTNKIYVSSGSVIAIDGATNQTTNIPVGNSPLGLAVNPVTNKIYVANNGSNNITMIDGTTNATTTLTDPTASGPFGVTVDALTNQIYVTNNGSNTVTVIDGATNALTSVALPGSSGQLFASLNPVTNTVYVAGGNSVTVIAGASTGTSDFALGATSAALTLTPGGQANDTIVVGPPYGNPVALTCSVSGPAPAPTCEFSATSVTPGPTYGTATLTITAPASAAMLVPFRRLHLNRMAYVAWLSLPFGITLVGALKRRRGSLLLAGLAVLLVLSLVACGGGASGGGNDGPTNYSVIVTGTSGAIQHTAQVTVWVSR